MLMSARAHPILGPFFLIMLVIVLALLLLHGLDDGLAAATEIEAFCLAVAMFLGLLLLERVRRRAPRPLVLVGSDRGPPSTRERATVTPSRPVKLALLAIPLRR